MFTFYFLAVVYEFTCQCDSGNVENIRYKTVPLREENPRSFRLKNTVKTNDSVILQHILDDSDCPKNYYDYIAVFASILMKLKQPLLCRQQDSFFGLRPCAHVFLIGLFRSTAMYIFPSLIFFTLILTFYFQ